MPTYEYQCKTCGTHFERVQHFSDAPVAECPQGHRTVQRVLSAPAIIFNAPGFYITDSRKNGNSKDRCGVASATTATKEEKQTAAKCATCQQ